MSIAKLQPEPASVAAFSVASLARRLAVKPHVILALIRAGELRALNVAAPGAKRPHWRILPEDLATFEMRRSVVPSGPAVPRQRKQRQDLELIDPATGKVKREFRVVGSVKAAMGKL